MKYFHGEIINELRHAVARLNNIAFKRINHIHSPNAAGVNMKGLCLKQSLR